MDCYRLLSLHHTSTQISALALKPEVIELAVELLTNTAQPSLDFLFLGVHSCSCRAGKVWNAAPDTPLPSRRISSQEFGALFPGEASPVFAGALGGRYQAATEKAAQARLGAPIHHRLTYAAIAALLPHQLRALEDAYEKVGLWAGVKEH